MIGSAFSARSLSPHNRKRLQTLYVLAAAGLAALIPLMLFAGLWIRSELGRSYRDVETFLGTRSVALSGRIDAEIEQQISALRAISAFPGLDGDTVEFQDTARRVTAVMPHWSILSLIDAASGRVIFTTAANPGQPPPESVLQAVRAEGKPRVETRRAGDATEILLFAPVLRNGVTTSVLVMSLDAMDVQDLVVRQGAESGLLSVIADRQDRILALSSGPPSIGAELGEQPRAAIAGRETGIFQGVREGEPLTSSFVRSPLTGWVSIVSTNRRHADKLSTRSVWATIAAGALSLILAGILAVFIIHTVMERRVSDERLAASRALGDLDARLLATTQDALNDQRRASSEREVLLREIYHRVKNNLQIVQSLLRLGSRDLRPEQREPFESAVRRIGAMARVHTLLYNSPDLASIDFKDYLDELLKELAEGFAAEERSIESVLAAEAMRMPLDTAVPLAFIAVEILTNAFKHAFPHGRPGKISVEVQRDQQGAVLTITDNGIGVVDPNPGKRHLGLTIVRKLVQQIGGTLEEPPAGSSTFVVRFPLHEEASAPIPALPLPEPVAS